MPGYASKSVKRLAHGKVEYNGEAHYTVAAAARLLKTNAMYIKKLMGAGELEWQNFRVNGPIYISQDSIRSQQRKLLTAMRDEHAAKKARKAGGGQKP